MTETATNRIGNRENEAALIGATLRNPSRFEEIASIVSREDFDWQPYGNAWKAIGNLHENHMGIDTITVGDELQRMGYLEEFSVGEGVMFTGRAALSKIREEGDPRNIETYASKVKDYANKRILMGYMNDGATWCLNGRTAEDIVSDMTKRFGEIVTFNAKSNTHTQTLAEGLGDAYDNLDLAARGELVSVPTGFMDLDRILGGMGGGDLLVAAARPGQGKTALLVSILKNVIEPRKKGVEKISGRRALICTLEMQNRQIAMRLIAQESGISYDKQKSGQLLETDWAKYTHTIEKLADKNDYKLIMNDLPSIRPSQIRQEVRKAMAKLGGLDLLVIDYIQLAGSDGKYETRALEVSNICRALKVIAKEFDIPVLAAAQLSRAVEMRGEKRPILSDLKESGGLEEAADVVMFIYRPDQYEKNTTMQNVAEIIVAKHRNGPVGSCELIYRSELTKFENATTRTFQPEAYRDHTDH